MDRSVAGRPVDVVTGVLVDPALQAAVRHGGNVWRVCLDKGLRGWFRGPASQIAEIKGGYVAKITSGASDLVAVE